jgi:hypothetical protein
MAPQIVYDNTTTQLTHSVGGGPPREIGNQISLSGRERVVTEFVFGYACDPGLTAHVRFYANDGPGGAPGTVLLDSGPFALASGGPTDKTVSFSTLVEMPDTFTWVVAYTGPANAGFGLLGFGSPTVGSFEHDWDHGNPPNFWMMDYRGPAVTRPVLRRPSSPRWMYSSGRSCLT